MHWFPIRKTTVIVHVGYGSTYADVFADDIRVRADDPFDISIDLNRGLRSRSKGVGTYLDARELADGEIDNLTSVQISEKQVYEGIDSHLNSLDETPKTWRLHVSLEGSHWFEVRPEVRAHHTLVLHVESQLSLSPSLAPRQARCGLPGSSRKTYTSAQRSESFSKFR